MADCIRSPAIWLFLHFSAAFAQDAQELRAFAGRQMAVGNHAVALDAYERISFFQRDALRFEDYLQWAGGHLKNKQYEEAMRQFDAASVMAADDSARFDVLLQKTQCLLAQRQFGYALADLIAFPDEMAPSLIRKRNLYMAVTYFGMEQFEESRRYFLSIIEDSTARKEVKKLFSENEHLQKRYNPRKARRLNMLLPGTGFWYHGDFWKGANSFLLTTGLLAGGAFYALTYTWLDAALLVIPWFQRYYTGGYVRAEKGTLRKRQSKQNARMIRLLELVKAPGVEGSRP